MIQPETYVEIIDNSGAKIAKCIQIPKKKKKAKIGDIIIVSIQELDLNKGFGKIKKGEIFKCLIIRTKFKTTRKDGNIIQFNENAGILLNNQNMPIGSRSFGYALQEMRTNYLKIMTIFDNII